MALVYLQGTGGGERLFEFVLAAPELGEFICELPKAPAALFFGEGAAFEGGEVALAGLFAAAHLPLDASQFVVASGPFAVCELGGRSERAFEKAAVGEFGREQLEDPLFECVCGDAFGGAAVCLAVAQAAVAGVVAVAGAAAVGGGAHHRVTAEAAAKKARE